MTDNCQYIEARRLLGPPVTENVSLKSANWGCLNRAKEGRGRL